MTASVGAHRRRGLLLSGLAGAAAGSGGAARAQPAAAERWPTRNITVIVPLPPGGQADLAARPVAAALQRILERPVTVENRAGAGALIGNAAAARAAPDGHTLLMTLSSLAILPEAERLFGRQPPYEASQLAPVARVLADPTVLAVRADAPWRSVADLAADARARPDAIPYGSSGPYGTTHVCMEMFAAASGVRLRHVPYRGGGPSITALLTGEVKAVASAPGPVRQHMEEGKARVLATWGAARVAAFPDAPTFIELGWPAVEFYIWAGLFAPQGVPEPVGGRLREAMRQVMASPEVVRTFEAAGSPPAFLDAPEFARFVEADSARLVAAVRRIGRVE